MEDIKIFELKRKDLKNAIVIDGFPSVGLVSSIVANYLINQLKLEQIAIMDSVYFPTVSLIRDSEPHTPVRIYAGGGERGSETRDMIVVFISEFQPPANIVKPIASTIIDWAEEQKCSLLVSPEGLVVEKDGGTDIADIKIYGVGSTKRARQLLVEPNVREFKEGVITGVAGVLLNEGKRRDFDVVSFLAEAHPDFPDARAAAKVIEIIGKLLLHTRLDAAPLYKEAERIETQLKIIQKQTTASKSTKDAGSAMYH